MEEDIRRQGTLHLQQQRFGKRWKRVWCVLFRESSRSVSRLEFFDCKDGVTVEKSRRQQENKKVIRLSDCIRVSEVEMDGCPRDTGPFLIETTEKIYVFAADRQQLEDWTHTLCEIAFPMNRTEAGGKRSSLLRGRGGDKDAGMENNSLYSGRETVRGFRVCVRSTEASHRSRLKGLDGFLRADVDALLLLKKSGDVMSTWPYRYLRRFGRDKTTFSLEAGRQCDSGEGCFEFDTEHGNFLFQAVEAAINLQRTSVLQRKTSCRTGSETPQDKTLPPLPLNPPLVQTRTPPLPQLRGHVPQCPAALEAGGVYSMVTETPHHKDKESCAASQQQQRQQLEAGGVYSMVTETPHHKDKESCAASQQQQRQQLSHLEPLGDKVLTGVKSLTLETRSIPRKNQVKTISSCPLPHQKPPGPLEHSRPPEHPGSGHDPDQTYSRTNLPEPEYSLPFDTIASALMSDILEPRRAIGAEAIADPLYDSIDEMKIRNVFLSDGGGTAGGKAEHIYDEPEGCAAPPPPSAMYDDVEEMRGDAWRLMGTAADPKGYEYPYDPRVDDYAVPKRAQRVLPVAQSTNKEENGEEESREEDQVEHCEPPYSNVRKKKV